MTARITVPATREISLPLPFSAQMLRAVRAHQKTQTRRVVRGQLKLVSGRTLFESASPSWEADDEEVLALWPQKLTCPYPVGATLWVKEGVEKRNGRAVYSADGAPVKQLKTWRWKRDFLPAMFCPRELSRIHLEVTGRRIERLTNITEADALAEGIVPSPGYPAVPAYAQLWDQLNADRGYSWHVNPWVWVVHFKLIEARRAA
ncbi:MAG TPA: hypothetical protein VFQ61_06510 [Polyangiaceae bacterium]|nr:hypothetical protein [Polyangiaceae bacterium]